MKYIGCDSDGDASELPTSLYRAAIVQNVLMHIIDWPTIFLIATVTLAKGDQDIL